MAHLMNVEKSKYINTQISIYAENKVGQYSKFLNKNPIFVTYYSVNIVMSRTDVGTGGIQQEIGEDSPLRFNKITNFPIYGIPDLRPDIDYDETGMDVNMDISDLTLLPNTIKPRSCDYILVKLPQTKQYLFRVNMFRYNTIQSNDFYTCEADIKKIGDNLEELIDKQVVETYDTIFENIGTQDKCFLRSDDTKSVIEIASIIKELREYYMNIFYNKETNSMVLYGTQEYPDIWYYDYYIAKFINESNLFYDNYSDNALLLTYNDLVPLNFDYQFKRTLYYAVMTKDVKFMNLYNYYYQATIAKNFSPFILNDIPCHSIRLHVCEREAMGESIQDGTNILHPYFPIEFIKILKSGVYEEPTEENPDNLYKMNYIQKLIFNYLHDKKENVNYSDILQYAFNHDMDTYMYMPLVIFILKKIYDEYFIRDTNQDILG